MRIAFMAELRRILLHYKRYPSETIAQVVIASASFYGLIAGGQFIVGAPILGERLNDLVISYVLWMLILNAVGDSGFGIAEEAETGTLEQLYLSPMQPTTLFLIRTSVNMLFSLVFVLIVLTLLIFLMKIPFAFDIVLLLPILLALLVAMGIGLLVASLAILFKRINQLLNIIQFGFLFLIMFPFAERGGLVAFVGHFIPLSPIFDWLRAVVAEQGMLAQHGGLLLYSLINTFLWFTLGILAFRYASKAAQKKARSVIIKWKKAPSAVLKDVAFLIKNTV